MMNESIYKSPEGKEILQHLYGNVLASWPVPHDEIHLDTCLGDTFIIGSGNKENPPLVLLHGASSNAVSWIGEITEYSKHFRTYAVDIPGDPGRSAESRPSWNGREYADWLSNIFDGLTLKQAYVLGLSQGGWNAIRFAVHFPEKVNKLVLLTPAGVTTDNPFFLVRAIFYTMLGKRGAEALNRYVFGEDEMDEATKVFMNAILTHFKPRIERLILFSDDELRILTMPVLLIGGNKDRIRNVSRISNKLEQILPDLITKLLPDRGHVLVNTASIVVPFLTGKGDDSA